MTHAITLRFKQHKDNRNAELKARLDAIEKSMRDGLEREARLMARCVELKAELEAQRVPLTWQPIETAPKDGTSVLIFRKGYLVPGIAYYGFGERWLFSSNGGFAGYPTNWMPLPPTPIGIKPKGQG